MTTFTKIKYEDIPQKSKESVQNWSDAEVSYDEIKLTTQENKEMEDYFIQEGYKKA